MICECFIMESFRHEPFGNTCNVMQVITYMYESMFPYPREETSINYEYYLNNDEVTIEKNCFMKHENLLKIAVIAGIVDTLLQILWNETVKISEEHTCINCHEV